MKYEIKKKTDLLDVIHLFKQSNDREIVAFDTETNGLNIKTCTPFLYQAGFLLGQSIITYVVDLEKHPALGRQVILATHELAKRCKYFAGHNIKFDMHMLANIDLSYDGDNLLDTQICIRLAHDSLTPANGGPPMGLKEYAAQYIHRGAKLHEHALSAERTKLSKTYNVMLTNRLKGFPNPPEGYKSWTKGALEDIFKDVISTYQDLPPDLQQVYELWYKSLPEEVTSRMTTPLVTSKDIPYNMLDRESVKSYGHMDIYYTLMLYLTTIPVIKTRKNMNALELECSIIKALWSMERVGFKINKEYILESKERMYNYIIKRRKDIIRLVGRTVAIGQHAVIKELLNTKFGQNVTTTNADELDVLLSKLKHDDIGLGLYEDVVDFIETIQELRTLEKWYSTYLLRFINEMRTTDRAYTQIHQVGTVSGRVTSDFQQFPKYGILDKDGNELFNPRQMVVVSKDEGFVGLGYLDYSQIELRLQAMYTILVDHPDLNLCRAYMPYQCHRSFDHKPFDYTNANDLATAYTDKWLLDEDETEWVPTDVHAATTHVAFPDVDMHSDEFKKLRGKVGKRVNFAKNYGAQFSRIKQMFPDYDDDTIHKIDDAYYTAFPGVKAYHAYCYNLASQSSYATNLFGIRYYGLTGHKLINTLIQGSGAYFLKLKMLAVHNYLKENNCKSRYQMNIHDEMSFEIYEGEEHILYDLQQIMQVFEDTLVPIVADLEVSTTTWAEKKEVGGIEDVKRLFYPEA